MGDLSYYIGAAIATGIYLATHRRKRLSGLEMLDRSPAAQTL